MVYYAHSLKDADESRWQPLAEHLLAVAGFGRAIRPRGLARR
jgi:hypothetical protein